MDRLYLYLALAIAGATAQAHAAENLFVCTSSEQLICDGQNCKIVPTDELSLSFQFSPDSKSISITEGEAGRGGSLLLQEDGETYALTGRLGPVKQGDNILSDPNDVAIIVATIVKKSKEFTVIYRGTISRGTCD